MHISIHEISIFCNYDKIYFMCPKCYVKMIPIVYGKLNPDLLDMQKDNKIIIGIGKYKAGKPLSYCPLCEESYDLFVMPE